ncbi:hypothetical protein [Terasakiispira papahanaumokuakeensis]|uniref:hypothetical protein n=1 Tax=Terasakiispira papahanaumokuakeensis TaxID=197479 RepID=UPI001111950D|nr:hypothetical protein [Terasakiispira papahanaumokuakeensis]
MDRLQFELRRKEKARAEKVVVASLCNQPEYRSCPPAFIVADQLDRGRYLASESTFYRVLRDYDQIHLRGRQKTPERKRQATTHKASEVNRLWAWDTPGCLGQREEPGSTYT